MSYSTIAASAVDQALTERITAATVQEAWTSAHDGNDYAGNVRASWPNATRMVWPVCIASDVADAYESALAAGNPNPGGDPAVVTDGMILANVAAKWPPDEAAP
jgi:hypothetical protein